jgi:hypothetical protein
MQWLVRIKEEGLGTLFHLRIHTKRVVAFFQVSRIQLELEPALRIGHCPNEHVVQENGGLRAVGETETPKSDKAARRSFPLGYV